VWSCAVFATEKSSLECGPNRPNTRFPWQLRYLLFAAFFLRSAHRFFIISDSFLRPAGLSLLAGFALTALLLGALLLASLVCEFEFDAVRILRAEVSLAISLSISCTILAVST
jgi:hypothetical protein